jgi:hypothetical protein
MSLKPGSGAAGETGGVRILAVDLLPPIIILTKRL